MLLVLYQTVKLAIEQGSLRTIAGKTDVLGPIGPAFLFGLEGIERRRVEVGNAIAVDPLAELSPKDLTRIVQPCGSRKSSPGTNQLLCLQSETPMSR